MKRNKKSFILHTDTISDILLDYNNEEKGIIFQSIVDYQNGNFNEDVAEKWVNRAIRPLISQFKRDDEKYIKICKARADAGSRGGKQKVANLAKGSKSKQRVANLADNDSDNDNDSVNDSVSKQERINIFMESVLEKNSDNNILSDFGVDEFVAYWTESGDRDSKLRFEKEKTFSTLARMKTWASRNYSGKSAYGSEVAIPKAKTEDRLKQIYSSRVLTDEAFAKSMYVEATEERRKLIKEHWRWTKKL